MFSVGSGTLQENPVAFQSLLSIFFTPLIGRWNPRLLRGSRSVLQQETDDLIGHPERTTALLATFGNE